MEITIKINIDGNQVDDIKVTPTAREKPSTELSITPEQFVEMSPDDIVAMQKNMRDSLEMSKELEVLSGHTGS